MRHTGCEIRDTRYAIPPLAGQVRDLPRHRHGGGVAVLLMALLSGCAVPRPQPPAWLVNPQASYPPSQYLAAVGEGDSRRAAEHSAAAGLARIFEADIRSAETLSETTVETRGARESLDQFSELRSAIQIDSAQKLLNVQFGEAFTDARGRVYTVAFLPRADTAEIYREKIGALCRDTVFLIRRSDVAPDPLRHYAFRRAAVRKALETDRLLEQLRVIHPQAHRAVLRPYDPQTLYTATAEAAHKVPFSVAVDHPVAREAVRGALASMGFSEQEDRPALEFAGSASLEESPIRRAPLVFVRWRLHLEVRDRSGQPVFFIEKSSREGHVSLEEAKARADRSLAAEAAALVRQETGAYLDRLAAAE